MTPLPLPHHLTYNHHHQLPTTIINWSQPTSHMPMDSNNMAMPCHQPQQLNEWEDDVAWPCCLDGDNDMRRHHSMVWGEYLLHPFITWLTTTAHSPSTDKDNDTVTTTRPLATHSLSTDEDEDTTSNHNHNHVHSVHNASTMVTWWPQPMTTTTTTTLNNRNTSMSTPTTTSTRPHMQTTAHVQDERTRMKMTAHVRGRPPTNENDCPCMKTTAHEWEWGNHSSRWVSQLYQTTPHHLPL